MSPGLPVRLVDSFTEPKDILQEFADISEEKMEIHSLCKTSSPSP